MLKNRLVITLLLLAAELVILKALPATSSAITWWGENADLAVAQMGPIHWDLAGYSSTPDLATYRAFFAQKCGSQRGHQAAICVAEALAGAFPEAEPATEWVNATYDPSAALAQHLAGAGGHCVTRSGLAATTLLSVGIAARVVQMSARTGLGHYAFEVLDGTQWMLIDPTAGASHGSAYQLIQAPSGSQGEAHQLPRGASDDQFKAFYAGELYHGMLLYPEPWLHTRTGDRVGSWPYRAAFVATGWPVPWLVVKLLVQWLLLPLTLMSLAALGLVRVTRKSQ